MLTKSTRSGRVFLQRLVLCLDVLWFENNRPDLPQQLVVGTA